MFYDEISKYFEWLVFLVGALQLLQLPATIYASKTPELGWRDDLCRLSQLNRRIATVMAIGVVLVGTGTGILVMIFKQEIAEGQNLAGAFSLFLAVFWAFRGGVQIGIYTRYWPQKPVLLLLCHYGLILLFSTLTFSYLLIFVRGLLC